MFGHLFGSIGVLAGNLTKTYCIPLSINLQDGMQTILNWKKEDHATPSHVVQMIENGYEAAKTFGKSLLLLDRYFLSVPALECLKQCNTDSEITMNTITKAKKSCNSYEKPPKKKSGRADHPKRAML